MPSSDCPDCGAAVAADARSCEECGRPSPGIEGIETRLRTYWSSPDLGLVAGALVTAVGVVLVGVQVWLWGLLALLVGIALVLVRVDAGRRATREALARVSAQRRVVGARSRGQVELFRLRRELAELQTERSSAYQELGRATHEGDAAAAERAAPQVDDVAVRIGAKEAEIAALQEQMAQRVRRAQAAAAPPEPARVPEPFPPPDEGAPPEPARVPEPFPEPVPEPSPDDPPPAPAPPPPPETAERAGPHTANT